MSKVVRIGNGAGFWGDNVDAPRRLAESSHLDYLTLEYLAELTLSILAGQRQKNPAMGYAGDFIDVLRSLTPALKKQPQLRIITNAGGMNPRACARAAAEVLAAAGLGDVPIGVASGDDLLDRMSELQSGGCRCENLDTGQSLAELNKPVVSANAYLGAQPIAEALAQGARVVVTGRVADASLTVAPAVYEFGWKWTDWDRLAGASVAGHLIECGAQVTGGLDRRWNELALADLGYPIAELSPDGSAVITKPEGSGGRVDRDIVVEQLVYEIGDPRHYLTPDVDVDFTAVEVAEVAPDCVKVMGARGADAPQNYKVSLAYQDGFTACGQLLVYGDDCVEKARACSQLILKRVRAGGYQLEHSHVECLGAGEGVPGVHAPPKDLREVVLRIAVRDSRREAVERFTRELAPLVTSGPPGIAGYATARSSVRPVFAYWPTLVPKRFVTPRTEMKKASDWVRARNP